MRLGPLGKSCARTVVPARPSRPAANRAFIKLDATCAPPCRCFLNVPAAAAHLASDDRQPYCENLTHPCRFGICLVVVEPLSLVSHPQLSCTHVRTRQQHPRRRAGPPPRGLASGHRTRLLHRRSQPAEPGPCRDGALAARARDHTLERRLRGPAGARGHRVLTGRDWRREGLQSIPNKTFSCHPAELPLINTDGSSAFSAQDFPLPDVKARFVGEAI